jgi:very-short-patch-repair endonuclease
MQRDDWSEPERLARRVLDDHGGAARLAAFLAAGLTEHQVAALRWRGFLERPRSGWYVDPALPWTAKHAIRVGGVLSCVSACDSFGLPVPVGSRRQVHVMLPGNAPRVRHHRDRRRYVVPGEDREVVRHWSIRDGTPKGWRTSLVETLVELAECVPLDWWVAALDAAFHTPRDGEPMLRGADLQRLRELVPKRLRAALDLIDPSAESCIETLLRLAMLRRGIAPITSQFVPHPAHRADFLVGGRLIVEADGEAFHDKEADRVRDEHLRSLGYRVLRFTYFEIVYGMEAVLDRIEAELAALGPSVS